MVAIDKPVWFRLYSKQQRCYLRREGRKWVTTPKQFLGHMWIDLRHTNKALNEAYASGQLPSTEDGYHFEPEQVEVTVRKLS